MSQDDWQYARTFNLLVADSDARQPVAAVAILINGADDNRHFRLPPETGSGRWQLAWSSATDSKLGETGAGVSATSVAVLLLLRNETDDQWQDA